MALTPHYGLNYFGGDIPGSLTDNGSKYTGADRLTLDRLIKALAGATRHVTTAAGTGTGPAAPTLTLTSGGLPGGASYTYCVTLVDANGLETLAGPEATLATPPILTAPDVPDVASATGTLPAGLYYYALTALRGSEESALGTQTTITLITGEGAVVATVPASPPDGATSYQLWRMNSADVAWTRVATADVTPGTTITDDGTVPANTNPVDPAQIPPAVNAGVSIYGTTIALADADAAAITAGSYASWKIYRTETPGAYPAASLVHNVVDRSDENDPTSAVLTTWTDDGDDTTTGIPPIVNAQLALAPYVLDHADALPDPAGYPDYYPILVAGTLYALIAGSWTAVTGGPDVDPAPTIPTFRGRWRPVVAYDVGDIVQAGTSLYQGGAGLYQAVAASTNITPYAGGWIGGFDITDTTNYTDSVDVTYPKMAQPFQLSGAWSFNAVALRTSPSFPVEVTVHIAADATASPTILASGTGLVDFEDVTNTWIRLDNTLTLTVGTTYYLLVDNPDGNALAASNNPTASGVIAVPAGTSLLYGDSDYSNTAAGTVLTMYLIPDAPSAWTCVYSISGR